MSFDLSKVTGAVKKMVEDIQKLDGDKKKIDTEREFNQLANLLANTSAKGDREYIEGLMVEYQENATKKAEENGRTKDGQKLIKNAKKMLGDKKVLDKAAEAQALVDELKNPNTYLSEQDKRDIINLIFKSGFGYLLEVREKATEKTVNVNVIVVDADLAGKSSDLNADEIQEQYKPQITKEVSKDNGQNENNQPSVEKNPPNLKVPNKSEDNSVDPPKTNKPHKVKVTEHQSNVGTAAADTVIREVDSFVADNDEIDRALADIDVSANSAFSFVGKFILQAGLNAGVNQKVFSVSDPKDKLTYTDTLKVMKALLKQADGIGLKNNPAYKALQAQITFGEQRVKNEGDNYDPDKTEQLNADQAINWLYNEMKPWVQ